MPQPANPVESARRLLRVTAEAVSLLLTKQDLSAAIQQSLDLIGEATDVDRTYLFRCYYDATGGGSVSQEFEWNSGYAEPQIDNPDLKNVPFAALPNFVQTAQAGRSVFGHVRDLDQEMRATLEPQGVVSILLLPIHVNNQFWGFVGFDACRGERLWTEEERSILVSFIASLSAAVERANADREIRKARDVAEAANRAKSAFIANVSHEIRTPLNAILGYSELLLERALDKPIADNIKGIKTAGYSLLSLINSILDLSKMEAEKLQLYPEPVRLDRLVEEVEALFAIQTRRKPIAFRCHLDPDLPKAVIVDPMRLRQILLNLLGNAFKFTAAGHVDFAVRRSSGPVDREPSADDRHTVDVEFVVSDSGIGIPAAIIDQLFEPFTQADPLENRRHEGTGLGLTISMRLARLMGGDIRVRSEQGDGSTFTVRVPRLRVFDTHQADGDPTQSATINAATILVVDDDPVHRAVLRKYLNGMVIDVLEAGDGTEALEIATEHWISAILLDIGMPVLDGWGFLRRLKSEPTFAGIPVIIITGSTTNPDAEAKAMAAAYLTKPVSYELLLSTLKQTVPALQLRGSAGGTASGEMAIIDRAINTSVVDRAAAEGARVTNAPSALFAHQEQIVGELAAQWESAAQLMSIDDIALFAERTRQVAVALHDTAAEAWARSLLAACDAFDIVEMEGIFRSFPRER